MFKAFTVPIQSKSLTHTRWSCKVHTRRRASIIAPSIASQHAVAKGVHFFKYQGLGNDFILIDNRDSVDVKLSPQRCAELCDRHFGIGADGVIFAMPPQAVGEDFSMRIFNADGSEPEMCGNGVRCLARFIHDQSRDKDAGDVGYTVGTLAGAIRTELRGDGGVAVDMGEPVFAPSEVPTTLATTTADGKVVRGELPVDGETWIVTAVSMGNPHCVTFGRIHECDGVGIKLDTFELSTYGPKLEAHAAFPRKCNVEFTEVKSRNYVKMHVWERGAGATLACGTGACATVVAGVLEGRLDRACTVELPGGPLEIEWREDNNRVVMTGPARYVFAGTVETR